MRKLLMAGAALALLGGTAWAQMQNGPSEQNMNQQLQNLQEQNPHVRTANPDRDQAKPDENGPAAQGQMEREPGAMRQNTSVRERETTSMRAHVATPTKVLAGPQKERIEKTVIESGNAPRLENVNFNVRVGAPIPRSVRVVPVPEEIVSIYPQWSGFLYFVSGDEIVVVDPNSYAVVGVLEA